MRPLHEPADFASIGEWIKGAKEYYIQAFRDSGDLIDGAGLSGFTEDEMKIFADIIRPWVPNVRLRGI